MTKVYVVMEEAEMYEEDRLLFADTDLEKSFEVVKKRRLPEDCYVEVWESGRAQGRYFWDRDYEDFMFHKQINESTFVPEERD